MPQNGVCMHVCMYMCVWHCACALDATRQRASWLSSSDFRSTLSFLPSLPACVHVSWLSKGTQKPSRKNPGLCSTHNKSKAKPQLKAAQCHTGSKISRAMHPPSAHKLTSITWVVTRGPQGIPTSHQLATRKNKCVGSVGKRLHRHSSSNRSE